MKNILLIWHVWFVIALPGTVYAHDHRVTDSWGLIEGVGYAMHVIFSLHHSPLLVLLGVLAALALLRKVYKQRSNIHDQDMLL